MPGWVYIIYRVIGSIGIEIVRPGSKLVPFIGILLEESAGVGVVVAGAQVGQAVGVWDD